MQRTLGGQTISLKDQILLRPVPRWPRNVLKDQGWQLIRDEIRRLAFHGLTEIPGERAFHVDIHDGHEPLLATCVFKERNDVTNATNAKNIFGLIQGHVFMGCVMQAWRLQPDQNGGLETADGPRDPITNEILPVPVPYPPPLADPSVSLSRGLSRPWSTQARPPTQNMVISQPGGSLNISQDHVPIQPLPAASIPMHASFNNVLAPPISPYATNLDLYQQRLGHFSPSVDDAIELSDSSRTLHNTPELSSSSRTSSVSAIPDAYLPARNSNHDAFNFIPGSPYPDYSSSISSTSNAYTPANSRSQSGSSHTFQDTTGDEGCKVIIRNVKAGVNREQLSVLIDQEMPPHSYVQHEEPKRGEDNKWSVKFSKREHAEKAKEQLNNFMFKGQKLKVHLSNGGPRRQINSGG